MEKIKDYSLYLVTSEEHSNGKSSLEVISSMLDMKAFLVIIPSLAIKMFKSENFIRMNGSETNPNGGVSIIT